MRGPAGIGRGGVSMAGGREGQGARKGFRICSSISAFCLDEKGCWRTSVLCTHTQEFLYISHLFHLFILLSYLIFDFVCLTLLSADTHGIAKYARTYIRDTHTHAHTHNKMKCRKIRKNKEIK